MNLKDEKLKLTDDLGNDLLSDISINNIMQDMTSKLIKDIEVKRVKIITKRLKEIVNYYIYI